MGQLEDRTFSKFFTVPFVRPRLKMKVSIFKVTIVNISRLRVKAGRCLRISLPGKQSNIQDSADGSKMLAEVVTITRRFNRNLT